MSKPAYTSPLQLNNKGQSMTDYTQVPNKLIMLKIPPAEKAILLVIARFTYGYQRIQCEMSLAQIAEYTDLSRRTVYKLVADLEKKGFLSVVRGKADGINTLNSYQLIDSYSGENISLPRENSSLGVGKNLHWGRENISPSKESIKENNNIPPIVPPRGDVSDESLASQSVEVETVEPVELDSKPVELDSKPVELDSKPVELDSKPVELPATPKRTRAKRGEITEATELAMKELINGCDCKTVPKGYLLSYLKYRHTVIKKPIKSTQGLQAQINVLAALSSKEAMEAAIKYTMDNEWIRIVVPEGKAPAKPDAMVMPHFDLSDGGTALQKWAVKQGFRSAKGKETAWDYLAAIKVLVAEKNGGAV